MPYSLERFVNAQERSYTTALSEIKNGRKQSHWMWYIFPQIQGLGLSETAKHYAINDIAEAAAFLQHPVLGSRLIEISKALLPLQSSNATRVLGTPDDMKLKSSMTLFASVPHADPVFKAVLEKFFGGRKDEKTLHIIEADIR